jgi:ketosteroid isomerase-like protein
MAAVDDVDELIERYDLALGEFYKGDPGPVQRLWSHRDDVTLAPPFGPPTHGWEEAAASMERGASQFADGEFVSTETVERYVTAELAHILRVERTKAKVGGSEEVATIALRVTMVFRPEVGEWKVGPGNDRARANPGDDIETEGDRCERVIRTGQRVDVGDMGD